MNEQEVAVKDHRSDGWDKNGKILMDKEEIKERWTEYCSELYTDKDIINQERVEDLEKISPPPRDDEDEYIGLLLEEVEEAVKRMPMNKSPGADEITASNKYMTYVTQCGKKEKCQRNG